MAGAMSNETEMSVAASAVYPGFKFSPTDVELISYYLKRKIDGLERSVEVIPDVEIYSFEPWDLPDKSIVKSESEWFFFCTRGRKYPHGSQNRRTTEMGYWKATGKERNVKSGSEVIGTKRTLVFHIGRAPKGERTEWIMHEYCMNGVPPDALVVCRLRRNPEFRASSSQTPAELNLPADKNIVLQNGTGLESVSEQEKMVDFYLSTDSGQKLLTDVAESSQNPQAAAEEDFYADILRDEIIKLDKAVIRAPPSRPPTANEIPTLQLEASTSRVLPLPDITDRQIQSMLQQEPEPPSGEGEGEKREENSTPWSNCIVGLFQIKRGNRHLLNVVFPVAIAVALLIYLVSQQGKNKLPFFGNFGH